jgi:hypothetical protein
MSSNFSIIDVISEFANASIEQSPFALINEVDGHDYYNTGAKVLMDWTDDSDTPTEPIATEEEARASRDREDALNKLLVLDDRMAKGMILIQATTKEKDAALALYVENKDTFKALMARLNYHTGRWDNLSYEEKRINRTAWSMWKNTLWAEANPVKDARNDNYEKFQTLKTNLNKYWDLWKQLRDQAQALAKEYNLWGSFFYLKNFEFNPYWCNPNPSDTTDLLWDITKTLDSQESAEMELFEYTHEEEVHVDWSFQDSRKAVRLTVEQMTLEQRKEVLASRPF